LVFDAVAPAAAAADMTLAFLFHPERSARLVQQSALHPRLPGLGEVLDRVLEGVFGPDYSDPYEAEVNRAVERVVVDRLVALASVAPMAQVRAVATQALAGIPDRLDDGPGEDPQGATDPATAHARLVSADIHRFLTRPQSPIASPAAPAPPPGSPIGDTGMSWTRSSHGWADAWEPGWTPWGSWWR
jgi:hypothetical protein